MLTASFCCFRGLSPAAELKLWQLGCLDWKSFNHLPPGTLSERKLSMVAAAIPAAQTAHDAGLPDFFLQRLPYPEKIRALRDFRAAAAYLDIETSGLDRNARVTTIGLLSNGKLEVFTRGIDLDLFLARIPNIKLLLTYNGTRFDLPMLRREFGIDLAIPHIDLMPVLARLGLKGGQKNCEILARLPRIHSSGTFGADAVELWHLFQTRGDRDALRRLILYNAEDVVMLEKLAAFAYNQTMNPYPIPVKISSEIPGQWQPEIIYANAL